MKLTPNRAPISESLVAVDATIGTSRLPSSVTQLIIYQDSDLWYERSFVHDPEKNPYRMTKTMMPAMSLTTSVQKTRTLMIRTQGMTTLKGPNLATNRLGTIRPTILAPFRIVIYQK